MNKEELEYRPIDGKTYTLFGNSVSTQKYYETIRMLTDTILEGIKDISTVIRILDNYSSRKKFLPWLLDSRNDKTHISTIVKLITPRLKEFTEETEDHLKSLPILKFWDRRLATTRDQYHLYMIEIELTNRLYESEFKKADKKVALLPYCLRDFSANCKAVKTGFDYQCKHCSKNCYQNHVSAILKKHNIEPYIWMSGSMKQLARYALKSGKSFAVLGIACIPELHWGMRNCRRNNIPVAGLPLNANRCIRWFGEFHTNSVDLGELEKLVSV